MRVKLSWVVVLCGAIASTAARADTNAVVAPDVEADAPQVLDHQRAVPRKPVLKRQRFELSTMASLSLNDAYYQHHAASASVTYYVHDAFGLSIGADYLYAHVRTHSVDDVRLSMTAVPAVFELPRAFVHADVVFVPLYGKLSIFDKVIVPFDTYASVGLGAATARDGRYPPAVNAAVGQRYMLSDWMALRFEVRTHLFLDTQRVNGQSRSDIQSYVMFNGGLSFFVPPSF